MEALFVIVDLYFVSKISVDAVATVGLTESVIMMVFAIAFGISAAATAMVARRIGEGNKEAAAIAAAQTILVGFSVAAVLGIFGLVYAEDVLRMMGAEEQLIATGSGYTKIMLGTNFVILLLFLLNGIFRGIGDAAIAMRSLWIANGLNIILDPLFIFGIGPFPELGVQGAAVATSIGRGTGVLYQLWILYKGSAIIQLRLKHFRLNIPIIKQILNLSAGGAGQHIIGTASWIFLMRFVAVFGSAEVAGYTTAIRVVFFTILPSWGMAMAAATLVGQNLGAKQPERAETSVWRTAYMNMTFLFFVSIVFFLFAQPIIGLFTNEAEVIRAGSMSLKILCIGYVFYAYGMVISQAINGAGDTKTPTILNLIAFWVVEIPLAAFMAFSLGWGPEGVYWTVAISETVFAILCIVVFRRGKWKEVRL